MGQGVAARIDRLQSAQLARDVYGRADAMLVVIARDLLEKVYRHQRDHGSRAPTFLLQRKFQNVRLLLGNVPVEQCLVLLEVADPNRHAIPMAPWIGHEISRREDSWRQNLPRALVRPQRKDMLCPVAGIKNRRDARVQKTGQRRDACLAVRWSQLRVDLAGDVEPALEMNVNIHQSRNQKSTLALDPPAPESTRQSAWRNRRNPLALHGNS